MRTISDKIQTDAGRYYARLVWAEGELSGDTIKSITVTAAINASSERLTLGATPAAQLTASVVTDSNLLNRQVQLLIGRGGEEVSIGVYTITNATVADGVATLSGYDAMYIAMERGYYPTITGATNARAVLADVAKAAGVKLVLPDGLNATVSSVQTGSTLREMAGYMAALLGCNARIDGDGALCVQWFTPCAVTLDADHIYSGGASLIGEDWVLGNLTCSVATRKTVTDADGITSQLDSDTTLTSGTGATGVSFSNVWMTQSLLDELYQRIGGLTYRGGELSVLGDLRIEPGDLIMVDILEGKPVQFPVMAQTLEYDGGLRMTLSAYAESESDGGGEGVSGPMTTAMERYAVELAQIRELDAQRAKITRAHIAQLNADKASVDDLTAFKADIEELTADKLSATDAALKYANIDFSNIGKAAIEQLYATSGIIKNLVIGDSTITGELVGVTIRGDLIEGGTVVADKLVVKGEDGLYYKLNTDGVTTEAQQTDYNSLSGQIIRAKSITASKIAVDDLVAFGATIGGFRLTDSALYSGVKDSPTNTTRGVYLDSSGQLCVGDSKSYLRYYKDSSGQYRLEIAAASMTLSTGQSVEAALQDASDKAQAAQEAVDAVEVGGTNLLEGSRTLQSFRVSGARVNNAYHDLTAVMTTGAWQGIYVDLSGVVSKWGLQAGDIVTHSVMVMTDFDADTKCRFTLYRAPAKNDLINLGTYTLRPGKWQKISATFAIPAGEMSTVARIETDYYENTEYSFSGKHMYFAAPKLERGNKATDWTPAPEDLASADDVSSLDTRLTTAETSITQNASAIALKASQASVDALSKDVTAKLDVCITTDPADRSKVISAINASADAIALNSNRLTIDSDNFKLAADGTVTATAGDIAGFKMRSKTVAGYGSKQQSLLGGHEANGKEYGLLLIPQSGGDDWDSSISFVNGSASVVLEAERKETVEGFERFSITGAPLNPSSGINISWYDGNGKAFRVDKDEAYAEVLRAGNLTVSSGATITNLTKLPLIGQTGTLAEDFNRYTTRGKYTCSSDGIVSAMANRPCPNAGTLYCIYPNDPSGTTATGTWKYLLQIYISYPGNVYIRKASTNGSGTLSWGSWVTYLHTGNTADYIVASGTSGIWTYIKYNSGIAVCYGRRDQGGLNTNQAWGSIYTSGVNTISAINYPFTFTSAPVETVSMMCGAAKRSAWLISSETQNTTSKTATYEFARGTANWEDAVISYVVCGRWK